MWSCEDVLQNCFYVEYSTKSKIRPVILSVWFGCYAWILYFMSESRLRLGRNRSIRCCVHYDFLVELTPESQSRDIVSKPVFLLFLANIHRTHVYHLSELKAHFTFAALNEQPYAQRLNSEFHKVSITYFLKNKSCCKSRVLKN